MIDNTYHAFVYVVSEMISDAAKMQGKRKLRNMVIKKEVQDRCTMIR